MPHPIAAGNRWKGGTVQGGACAIASATAKLPLTGLRWRATQSGAEEAPSEEMTCRDWYMGQRR